MKIYLGADHRGYELKNELKKQLNTEYEDLGALKLDELDDFPIYANIVANAVLKNNNSIGLLMCGSGQGMAIAANRHNGIRAVLCSSVQEVIDARTDDNANILVISADEFEDRIDYLLEMLTAFIETKFDASPKRLRRLEELDEL